MYERRQMFTLLANDTRVLTLYFPYWIEKRMSFMVSEEELRV